MVWWIFQLSNVLQDKRVNRLRKRLLLESSQMKLDDAIMLFHDFWQSHTISWSKGGMWCSTIGIPSGATRMSHNIYLLDWLSPLNWNSFCNYTYISLFYTIIHVYPIEITLVLHCCNTRKWKWGLMGQNHKKRWNLQQQNSHS